MESWARDSSIVAWSGSQKMSPARVTPPPRAMVSESTSLVRLASWMPRVVAAVKMSRVAMAVRS
jgi:hypothetical protein